MLTDLGTRDLIQAGKAVSPSQVSSCSFQNAFFYLQWPDDPTFLTNPPLTALLKTRRRQKLHPPKQRSKYICLPSAVKEAGNHFIWEFKRGKTLNVPPSYGFLHHYRVCEFGGESNGHKESTTTSMLLNILLQEKIVLRMTLLKMWESPQLMDWHFWQMWNKGWNSQNASLSQSPLSLMKVLVKLQY